MRQFLKVYEKLSFYRPALVSGIKVNVGNPPNIPPNYHKSFQRYISVDICSDTLRAEIPSIFLEKS